MDALAVRPAVPVAYQHEPTTRAVDEVVRRAKRAIHANGSRRLSVGSFPLLPRDDFAMKPHRYLPRLFASD